MLQLVAGSVVMAFEEVCPERIDLIHKNYRKLCNLLIDVEEWGQVVIINMLTRYARTQFLNPNINVSSLPSLFPRLLCGFGEETAGLNYLRCLFCGLIIFPIFCCCHYSKRNLSYQYFLLLISNLIIFTHVRNK